MDVSEEEQIDEKEDERQYEFKLVGVVCHMGSADAGHYLSYINVERDKENKEGTHTEMSDSWTQTEKQRWLEFNDSTVTMFNTANIENTCFGG